MGKIQVAEVTASNLDSFGELLHSYFITKYPELIEVDEPKNWDDVKGAINELYRKLGIIDKPNPQSKRTPVAPTHEPTNRQGVASIVAGEETQLNNRVETIPPEENRWDMRVGDVLTSDNNTRIYVVTGMAYNTPRTFPLLHEEDKLLFSAVYTPPLKVHRPLLGNLNQEEYENFVTENIESLIPPVNINSSSFKSRAVPSESTAIQIGDLILGVDPVQVSFTTQNGYQIFPTVRTDGNPKLSTTQQIKNISISLIFPNEDAINYQLMPLYAMFRRTPFVNIRNREISKFFSEIRPESKSGWIPVALESINIQSIDGFPNSLQADISILPFDPANTGLSALKALLSVNDVVTQQEDSRIDITQKEIDQLLQIKQGNMTQDLDKLKDLMVKDVSSSENFRESFPFRAFYQSLISHYQGVTNEDGTPAKAINATNQYTDSDMVLFENFRPTKRENRLGRYTPQHNKTPVTLSYNYIPADYKTILEELRNDRQNLFTERNNRLAEYDEFIKDERSLVNIIVPFFTNRQDIIRNKKYKFSQIENSVKDAFSAKGWDSASSNQTYESTNIILRMLLHNLGVYPAVHAWNDLKDMADPENRKKVSSTVQSWIWGDQIVFTDPNTSQGGGEYNKSLQQAFHDIWLYIENDEEKRKQFYEIIDHCVQRLLGPLAGFKNRALMDNEGFVEGGDNSFEIERLPISTEHIEIDNRYDVITHWSLSFTNKFTPFYLQTNKYPFYQHLGFEDATMSFRVTSTPRPIENGVRYDLKAKLSELSDRMTESTKLVTHSAPELAVFLDPRVHITADTNNIFNAFGVRTAVLNSANTTNRQGLPDTWNTLVNLTQAKFTIDQYHSIEQVPTLYPVEEWIMHLVMRLKKDDDGNFVVKKYYAPDLSDPDLQSLMYMSFVDSTAGKDFDKWLKEILKGTNSTEASKLAKESNLAEHLSEAKKLLNDTYNGWNEKDSFGVHNRFQWDSIDETATTALQTALSDNRGQDLARVLTTIYYKYNDLLETYNEILKALIAPNISGFLSDFLTMSRIPSPIEVIIFITAPNRLGTLLASASYVGRMVADIGNTAINNKMSKFRAKNAELINNFIESTKKDLLLEFSHRLSKDPLVRDTLLSNKIVFGDRIKIYEEKGVADPVTQLKNDRSQLQGYNSYPDFDLNPIVATRDKKQLRVSPDFYIEVDNVHRSLIKDYIKDNFISTLSSARIAIQNSVLTRADTIVRFDNIIKYLESGNKEDLKQYDSVLTDKMLRGLEQTIGYDRETGLNDALKSTVSDYVKVVLDVTAQDSSNQIIPPEEQEIYRNQFLETAVARKLSDEEIKEHLKLMEDAFIGVQPGWNNQDAVKYNYVRAQRDLIMIELMELFWAVGSYLDSTGRFQMEGSPDSQTKAALEKIEKMRGVDGALSKTLGEQSGKTLKELRLAIKGILTNAESVTSSIMNNDKKLSKENQIKAYELSKKEGIGIVKDHLYKKDLTKAGIAVSSQETGVSIPEIRILQNMIYNKIGYFIRLNSVVQQYNPDVGEGGVFQGDVSLDTLPELKFLEYFNRRELESSFRKLRVTSDLEDMHNRQNLMSTRMFPTFKFFIIEEDGKLAALDDIYSFNAIQSIEIVKNKDMASDTAMVRLSNITGSLTDRLSFHREASDYMNVNAPITNDEAFFGTLNIKPGSKIMIKMGYGTTNLNLKTVFSGRIIEMNVGPVTEIIAQSYGAQLKQELYAENFGFWAGIKEHGDIASALLDKIPGLENFGSKELFSLMGASGGKDFKNIRRNIFDRFVMSNILGRVNSNAFTSDNPRDENIYLPYDLSVVTKWDPKFTWKVHQQSVWDALKELCLFHSNKSMIVRPYNDDALSSRSEQRETLVIGNKNGYYKHTDSYSLSSLDFAEIEARLHQFGKLKTKITNDTSNVIVSDDINKPRGAIYKSRFKFSDIVNIEVIDTDYATQTKSTVDFKRSADTVPDWSNIAKITLKSGWLDAWNFFSDKTNYVIIGKYLLNRIDVTVDDTAQLVEEYTRAALTKLTGAKSLSTPEEKFLYYAAKFMRQGFTGDPTTDSISRYIPKLNNFERMLQMVQELKEKDSSVFDEMQPEQFYEVRVLNDNLDRRLIADPRYKKIQKHHFAADSYNLIANDIILNSNFPNMINLYYFDDPKMISDNNLTPKDLDKLNVFPIKAFRGIKDEHLRPMNSFEKNIDTSWIDIAKTENMLENGYERIKINAKSNGLLETTRNKVLNTAGVNVKSQVEKALQDSFPEFGAMNLGSPDWRAFPSFVLVGVNLLKKEVQKMYRGTIKLVGDPTIEPLDIIHIDDLLNDMQGAVEIEEVVHSFTPDQGFTTTITPCMITYDRDPMQIEDEAIVNRVLTAARNNRDWNTGKAAIAGTAMLGTALVGAPVAAIAFAPFAWSGLQGMTKGYHRFINDAMIEIFGGDVINFTTLTHKGLPYMAGFDGVDYTSMRTIINEKTRRTKGFLTRWSSFKDPFRAWVSTGFDPDKYGIGAMFGDNIFLRHLSTLKNRGLSSESIGFFDVFWGANDIGEYFKR